MAILTPTNTSPNPANYYIGRGIVTWTRDGGSARDLGNCPSMQLKPAVKNLDHFSSRKGLHLKDRSVITEANMTLVMQLDEWTGDNLAMALMALEGGGTIQIMSLAEVTGGINFVGTNEVGAPVTMILPSVSFTPTGTLDFISADKYGIIEVTGDVLADPLTGSFGTLDWNTAIPA
jgi:hypothetical protein